MIKTIEINDLQAMDRLAQKVAAFLRPGFVLCLAGDLGAGKTTFTQFLARAMGITDAVNSPTFTILKVYEHVLPLYHIDAYRLEGIGADFELEEYIHSDGVAVVEWYEHILESLPDERLEITIKWTGEESRLVTLKGSGMYATLVETLGD